MLSSGAALALLGMWKGLRVLSSVYILGASFVIDVHLPPSVCCCGFEGTRGGPRPDSMLTCLATFSKLRAASSKHEFTGMH